MPTNELCHCDEAGCNRRHCADYVDGCGDSKCPIVRPWDPDRAYAAGYAYASGYHD